MAANPTVRWAVWLACLCTWTFLLLVSFPVEVGHRVIGDQMHFIISKLTHFGSYAFLTVLGSSLNLPKKYRWVLPLFLLFHGCLTEYLQNFVPLRSGSVRDIGIDLSGIILGIYLSRKSWMSAAS